MPDYRIEWLRDRISKTLGIFHLDVLDTFVTDHLEQLQTFFDDEVNNINDFEKCIFYVYRTFYDRLVEREVITIEKVPRIITPPPVVVDVPKEKKGKKGKAKKGRDIREEDAEVRPDPDIDEDTLETTRSEKKKKDKPIRRRKGVIDDSEPEGTPDRPPVIQEFSLIEVRKIERSFEKTPILHLAFGINPPEEIDENMRCVYFIRKSAEPIAHFDRAEEAMAEMSQMFYLGSLKGSFMHNLADITMSVWKTTVDLQLRIPLTREKETFESRDQEDIETQEKIGLIDFSKPSDFRLKAITSNYTGFPNGDELNSGKVSANGITSPSSATTTKTGNTPYEEPTPLTHDEKWKELCALADHEATLGRESMCKAPEKVSSTIEILQNNLDKFQSTIQWTIDHAICAFTLPTQYIAPGQESIIDDEDKVKIKVDPIKMSLDDITTPQLEEIVDGWIKYVTKAFRDALDKEPDDPTPISEYELWVEREKEYNNIIEQLKSPFAQLVFDKLKKSESSVLSGWPQIIEKLHIERDLARENAEYLSTLQEYFIKIRDQENFSFIISIVPSMMTGLRHIWTMSSYYCSDENMLILLTKISNIFTIKVKQIVDLEKIFSLSATAAYQRAIECVNLLQCWKNSYMETRAQIENSGVGSRWEFDKKILFGQVDHVTRISQDIANVAKAFYEFENMFGHRLRTYVADPEEVDIMIKKVYRLLQHILNIDYDIFVPNNKDNWEATLEYFYKCLESVENEAKKVLDQCIDSLKSAEQGLDLIKHLNGVETREKLLKNLLSKKENIMRKFVTEVGIVENEFLKHRKDPPLQRNQNKYSGAVIWVRFLFEKLKKSVVAFRTMEDNENTSEESYLKRSAFNQYYAISRDMTAFEKDIFSRFLQEGTFVVNNVLKRNILKLKYLSLPIEAYEEKVKKKDVQLAPVRISKSKQKQKTGATLASIKKEPTGKSKFSTMSTTIKWMITRPGQDSPDLALAQKLVKKSSIESLNSKDARSDFKISQAKLMTIATQQAKLPTWKEVIGNSLLIEYELKFDVNFSHQIFDIMTEGQQFEFLGFTLNPVIRMAIMRKEQLSSDVEQVTKVVNEYNNIVAKMTPAEIQFLRENLYEVESMIQVGLGRYTWQTLNIKYFCDSCQKLLKNLDAIVSQINYMGRDIKLKVTTLESYCFFSFEKDQFKDSSTMTTQIILKTARSKKQKSETPDDIDNTAEYEMSRKKSVRIQERDDFIKPCLEYFRSLELERNKKTIEVEKLYNSIGPTMIKLESLILGTFTGESEKMNHYYIYWEKELFSALVRFTTKNLEGFSKNLLKDEAIFEVDAVLAAPEINMKPAAHEVYNIMIHSVKDFLERLKCFRRWMTETCLPCPPAKDEKNELYVFTFYEDVVQLPKVYELVLSLQQTIQGLVSEVRSYLSRWHKYKSLWMYDKNVVCDKYLNRGIPLVRLDEKFIFYTQIINDLENVKPYYDIKSIRINLQPLIQAIIEHAVEWRNTLGNMLSDKTCMEMVALNTEFKTLRLNLDRNIKQLADFKIVMSTINIIQTTTLTMELKIKEMQETYNVLEEHRIKFPYGDMLMAYHLEKRWKKLFNSALYRIQTLHSTKVKFSQMTLNDIKIFCSNLNDFIFKFQTEGPGTVEQDMDKGQKLMENYGEEFERLDAIRLEMVNAEKLFDIEMTDYSHFLNAKEDFEKMLVIYKLYQTQKVARETWSKTLWANLNPQALTEGIENFLRDFRKLPKPIKQMPIGQALELNMKQFKNVVPLMVNLKNEALRERHWKMLMEKTGKVFDMSPGRFTLENMFSMELHKYTNIVEEIVTNAVKELAIERGVKEIAETWDKINFNIIKHVKDGEEVGSLLGSTEEIIQILNDNSMNLQSMIGSQFIGPFLQTVQKWEKCLNMVTEIIDEWLEVQKKWLYLEGIFIGGDISEQLPDEARRFNDIDKAFKRIMSDTANTLVVVDVCMAPGRLAELQGLSAGLDKCQKSLNDYLESKKNIFPRFYFISTEELLSILGSNKCSDVQEHMIKMFDNVKSMNFRETRSKQTFVTALKSSEGEIMVFKNHIETEGRVENWMNLVLDETRKSNRFLTKKAIFDYGKIKDISRPDWIMRYPGMICLAANQVWWTSEVEEVFQKIKLGNKRAMKEYLEKQNKQIDDLVKKVREDLTSNDRKKFKTIATIDVHARDIIEAFVRDSVLDAQEFGWESQLRFYWMKDVDNLYVVQCTGQFEYGYEYMGLNGRLVITPLTDRIYLTITQALTMRLGAAPSGPAGTGKTETTKDLAKAIALLCIVTNCGEGMDYRAVGTILSGLVQCGAWGCFDEFNRIDVSVLSVISTQLQTIRNGLLTNSVRFTFDGREINLNKNVGIFITMNPGYAGRVELPESIKAIFRPVTCIMPDLELICLISLFSDGFLTAKVLAKKMTVLYKLAREQLSKQYHYDWGLRSMNAVLRMAGVVKRSMPDTAENVVLMKVLRDSNIPKFVFDDVPLFLGLLKDLFPGVECPRIGYPDLNQAITLILESSNFILLPDQIDKVVQLYETMLTRHCAMLVGPTGGGKSVVINTLVNAQISMGFPTKLTVLNPKACSVIELYGHLDIETRDWVDGLFSNIFREMNKPADENVKRYICFDGDVDALWIENMNSVMDDNKLLTLSNGERIFLQSHCSLLFEVGNLAYASPATVSRAGMVFVDPKNLGYYPYWQRWLKTRPKTEQQKLEEIYQAIVPECIGYILEGVDGSTQVEPLKMIVPQTDLNMTVQLCNMLDALCPHNENVKTIYDDEALECIFLECVYYSLGAVLVEESRKRFDAFIKKISPRMAVDDSVDSPANNTQFPTSHPTLFDYFFDNEKKQWIAWEWIVPMYTHNPLIKFNDILVPTVDTLRTEKILSLMNDIKRPIVLVGESGTAKTAIISSCLRNLNMDTYILLNINFSSRTTSMDVQKTIETAVEKRTKNIYGPPVGRKLVAFIDDMNMPKVDEYGTQQPIALLKLLLEHGGMYDRGKDLNWKIYKDISFMAAMGKAGGGRNEVDPRFLSMFTVVNLLFPVDATLKHIYGNILKGHLENFPESLISVADIIIQITLNLFKIISTELPPTPSKFHYIFNLKDLSRTFAGMTLISPKIIQDPKQLVRVWRNEFMRVFCDRLNTYEDVELMKKHLASEINKHFQLPDRRTRLTKKSVETIGVKESLSEMRINDYVLRDPILFGDYRHGIVDEEERVYEDLLDYGAVMHLFKEIIDEYNDRAGFLDLVFFDDCLDHLTRVHRVLRMYKGHLLLIGVGGCGKHSIVKLASFAAGCDIFEITLNRNYNENSFKEDLKTLFYKLIEEPTVFLFSSAQIAEEGFLEFINNILTTGIVPALFTDEERDMIIVNCRDAAKKAGYSVSKDGVWKYFHDKCAENLHVVLSMSPSGDMLRNRCRNFPGLIGNTTIDWVFPWPDQALHSVARGFLMENKKIPDFLKESISDHVVHVHNSLTYYTQEYLNTLKRRNFITPKHYLDYLNTYVKLLEEKDQFTSKQINRLTDGTQKISFASTQIGELRKEVEETQLKVVESAEICEAFLKNIDESSQKTIRKKKELSERAQELDQSRKKIHIESAEAEEALEKALPALEQARLALDQLNKNDITEIRSFATPPESVQIVCECVAIIKGYREISWKTAKGMMAEGNFLKSLQELNVDNITPKQVANVRSHMKKSTKLDEMKAVSRAGFGLLKYVRAVLGYCDVFREVKPKRDRVNNLQKELQEKLEVLKAWEEQIQVMEEDLVKMNRDYEESIRKKEELKDLLEMSERRLSAADRLIAGLISEQSRWTDDLERFKREKINIVGSCLLSSSFMAYLAAFSSEFRKSIIYEDWLVNMQENDIPINIPFRLESNLSSDVEISTWNSQGLPPDEFSIQNGILTIKGSRFPLCIDPQQQALSWIKKMELNNLKILSFTDPDYLKHLEMAIKYGNPVLFQDIDDFIDPVIENVLEKNFRYRTGQTFVTLGDKEVDVDSNFRLYMTTKISNPILEPSIYAKALVINYAVTFDGLEDQLLGVVVRSERLDLEEQREMLVEETFINKNLLATLEDSLLRELTSSTGNMLDNVELIETLENTKLKSTEVSAKLEEAAITAHDIEMVRNGYRPAAQRGALLFFVLSELSLVNPMYQYSLSSYLDLFSHSLKKAETSYDLDKRLDNILKTLTKNVYEFGCIGIFEKHKLMFSFQMTAKLQKHISQLSQKEFEFFIKGSVSLEKSEKPCPAPWLSESGWQNLLKLAADFQEPFSEILEHFENYPMEWKDWYDLEMPESVDYPGGFCDQMTEFQKMMVLRCFRVDRVYRAMSNYIADIMGEEYITPPVVNLDSIYQQTTTTMPVMFMLSPGSDPSEELRKLAERQGMGGEKLKYLSLGQGQEGAALKLLELSATEGYWLVLQNGHLLLPFIKFLEKYLEKSENLHNEFRLWITTEPISTFPIGILQRSLKVVTEPPNGLKLNLRATFIKLQPDTLEMCAHEAFKPLVYVVAFFNAVVQERRKYGKMGWNISYDFNESDLNVSLQILNTYLSKVIKDERIPWSSLKYLIGEVMYGGRVIDDFDRRIVRVYMEEYMGDFLFDTFQPFHFYRDDSVDYKIPFISTRDHLIETTDSLPLSNTPEVFGLHPNAEIGYYTQTTREIWNHLIELQPQTGSAGDGISRDEFIDNVAKDILRHLPPPFTIWKIKKSFAMNITPTLVVLLQELERFNTLVERMSSTLNMLRKALAGEIGMDALLEQIANSLYNGQIPDNWRRWAPDTCKQLASWIEHLNMRNVQYKYWSSSGEPLVMWLSGLHIPESFLTALVQIACRKNNWPLDRSTLFTTVTDYSDPDDVEDRPLSGCYVHGLFLEGARWSLRNKCLEKSLPKVLVEPLPILSIQPIEAHRLKLQNTFRTPVYTTSKRRNAMGVGLVFEADLGTTVHVNRWVLQSVCLTLNDD